MDKTQPNPEQEALALMLDLAVTPRAKLAFLLLYGWINDIPFNYCENSNLFLMVYQLTEYRQSKSAHLIWLLRTYSVWLEPVFDNLYTDKPLITLIEILDEWGEPAPQRTYAFGVDKDFYNAFEHGTDNYPLFHAVPSIEPDLKELQHLLEEMLPPLYVVQEIEDPFAL